MIQKFLNLADEDQHQLNNGSYNRIPRDMISAFFRASYIRNRAAVQPQNVQPGEISDNGAQIKYAVNNEVYYQDRTRPVSR